MELQNEKHLDPVFLSVGQKVYSNAYAEQLRRDNEGLKSSGKTALNLIPQAGFQESVKMCDADFLVIGGNRGGGKTFIAQFDCVENLDNSNFVGYGFRKMEDDIKRGLWESSKHVFGNMKGATPTESSFEWRFPSGARFKMEQLFDSKTIRNRFRGAELPFILIEELQEYTKDDMDVIFTLIGSNRNTIGVKNRFIATCNPVGRSNQLRHFLDWYIDPDTDKIIPERSGKIRYFYRCGKSIKDIVWGDSKEEVYLNINAKTKIDRIATASGQEPLSLITSFCFIEGSYSDNKILQVVDKQYLAKLMAQGDETSEKDVLGIWRDQDDAVGEIKIEDMIKTFDNVEQRTGIMYASADVALTQDMFVIYASDGRHIVDIDAWVGMPTDSVVPFISHFLEKNGVRKERFTYDSNGLGLWLKDHFQSSPQFNNKSQSSNQKLWNNKKSECAENFAINIRNSRWSIDNRLLDKQFRDKDGNAFTVRDRLLAESKAVKKKIDASRFEIIAKSQMKVEVGHSPDFIEGWFMIESLMNTSNTQKISGIEWL